MSRYLYRYHKGSSLAFPKVPLSFWVLFRLFLYVLSFYVFPIQKMSHSRCRKYFDTVLNAGYFGYSRE